MTAHATIAPDEAAKCRWDVVVIGAGPAGALAAGLSARDGLRTLLVERKPFPRIKTCGACVNQRAVSVLDACGLRELVPSSGAVPLHRFALHSPGRAGTLALPGGAAISRPLFDALLVEAAIERGAAFLPETAAEVRPAEEGREAGRRQVHLRRGNERIGVAARMIVAADGLGHSSLRSHAEFQSRVARDARVGVGAIVDDVPDAYEPGTIYMAVGRTGYVGLACIETGALNIAAALDAHGLRSFGSPGAAASAILSDAGLPRPSSLAAADWQGTVPLTRRTPRPAAERLLLLGDATGYVEPFTGEGIAWALASAAMAMPLVRQGVDRWSETLEAQWNSILSQRIVRRQRWCRWLARALRSPWAAQGLVEVLGRFPVLARPLVRHLNAPFQPIGTHE